MAEIQKPSDQNRPDDSRAGKPDSLHPDRSVSGTDVGKAEKQRTTKFTTFGQMTTINDGESLVEARARQSALDNPLTIDFGDGTAVTSDGIQDAHDVVIAGNPFKDAQEFVKKTGENLWHPDSEHPDIRMNYMADLEAFQTTGLAKYGIDPLIISATIRNEIIFRKHSDNLQDRILKEHSDIANQADRNHSWTIGDIQMRRSHIERLISATDNAGNPRFPQLASLKEEGAIAALDRQKGALLVGVYFQDVATRLDHKEDPAPWYNLAHAAEIKSHIAALWQSGSADNKTEALIRSYNPGDGARHVEHVREQLKLIRNGPAKLFE